MNIHIYYTNKFFNLLLFFHTIYYFTYNILRFCKFSNSIGSSDILLDLISLF